MDEVSSLWVLCRSSRAIRTRVRLFHLVLLIPCWESQRAHPEEKRGPASDINQSGQKHMKTLDADRPNREDPNNDPSARVG